MPHITEQKSPPAKHQIQNIQDKTREIARYAMIGASNESIAKKLGMCRQQISAIRNSSIFRRYMDELHAMRDQAFIDNTRELEQLIPQAIDSYREVLEKKAGNDALRVKVAGEVLDRSGISEVRRSVVQRANIHLSMDDIAEIRRRAEENRKRREAIPVEYSCVGESVAEGSG